MQRTKAELEQEIAELRATIEELHEQLSARDAIVAKSAEDGWLVTTPNARYSGVTAGVEFRGGRTFIPKVEGTESIIRLLQFDFGYKVTPMTSKDFQALKVEAPAPEEKTMLENIMMPHVAGGD